MITGFSSDNSYSIAAKIISILFHPLLLPFYTFATIFFFDFYAVSQISMYGKLIILGFLVLMTIVFPIILNIFLHKKGIISSYTLEKREERIYPYLLTAIFYYFTYYTLRQMPISPLFFVLMLGATLLLIITLLINFLTKISAHMISIGGTIGALIGISFLYELNLSVVIMIAMIIAGIVASARLYLQSHNYGQIFSGFMVGLLTMLLLFFRISMQ